MEESKKITKQKDLIHKYDWDTLIVLDSCRFDYFKDLCFDYLQGSLRLVESSASDTFTWLGSVFPEKYNITVYSSHPVLNSMGIERGGYKSSDHFSTIYNIWQRGWDKDLGTTPPWAVNRYVTKYVKTGKWQGKNIVWYMQPHAPCIGDTKITGHADGCNDKKSVHQIWKDLKTGKISKDKLRRAYSDNLKLVLEHVSFITPLLKGVTVITADHGERLGEKNKFGHSSHTLVKELIEVPWFVIVSE